MKKTNVEIGEDSCGYHDNGANHAPRSKPNKGNKLRKALKLERKRNMLLVAKLVAIAPYLNAMKWLKDLFGSREYRLVQRQKFRSLTQGADESDLKYVKRVIASAKLCDFDEEKLTESVTEVLQLHALNSKVREAGRKVMRKGGTLTALVDKIRGYELDKTNEEIFKKTHQPEAEAIVAAVTRGRVETDSSARHPSGLRGKSIEYQGRPNWRNFRDNGNNYERQIYC
ncbi:uncharacterized protein LOC120893825 [Anopheles arabiensis]|uniref:uncharacterized protein LOC120893825 n=1 Tax=Anopheles arabiensis TaxID=7173 RepID=UPI001AADAB72|nr:uncharacterized protein LOC120893825 [Anopheles arabiensis]